MSGKDFVSACSSTSNSTRNDNIYDYCAFCLSKHDLKVTATHFCSDCGHLGHFLCEKCLSYHNHFSEHRNVQSIAGAKYDKKCKQTNEVKDGVEQRSKTKQSGETIKEQGLDVSNKEQPTVRNEVGGRSRQAEARIDEAIKKEENEIDELKDRTQRTKNSDGANGSDLAYTELGLLWTVLKDEFWQLAFNAFISDTRDSVQYISYTLLAVLQASFRQCKEQATGHRTGMMFQAYFPGENAQQNKNLKLPKATAMVVMANVREDKSIAKHFKKSKLLQDTMEKYLEKCVGFCWIACFKEPEVRLITTPLKECKNISREFKGLDRTTHKARKDAAFVKWPALVQGDTILMPWHLYPASKKRPDATFRLVDPTNDFRVTRVESNDETLINDTEEDKSTEAKYQSPSGTSGEDSIHDVSKIRIKNEATNKTTSNETVNVNRYDGSKKRDTLTQAKHGKKQNYEEVKHEGQGKKSLNF